MTGEQQTVCVSEMAQHLYLIFVFPLFFFVWICFFEAYQFFNLSKGISLKKP
jgi:hypothetical protein